MVDQLDSPQLIQWLVYHIPLEVEHFNLFDLRKVYIQRNGFDKACVEEWNLVINSKVRLFLDANLVTLVYFPFVPVGGRNWE